MAFRLGEYVVYGELRNTSNYSTHGFIALRGETPDEPTMVHIELTGNCDPDLRGKIFRFMPRGDGTEAAVFRRQDLARFQDRQIGPTGTMTAQGWVKALPCSVEEYLRRAELGEKPPTEWKRRLYLEWFSQNGRVLVEMADAIVEECVRAPEKGNDEDEGDWAPIPNCAPAPDDEELSAKTGLEFTIMRADGDTVDIERWRPVRADKDARDESEFDPLRGSLQKQLDSEASAIDRAIRGADSNDDDDDIIAECELMDYCIENCEGEPMGPLLDGADRLPNPDDLGDAEVETKLKGILAQLALMGVALHVCKHFTPRECYRLLKDTILGKSRVYRELAGTGWVQHHSTSDHCPKCDAEFEEEYAKSLEEQRGGDDLPSNL